MKTATLPQCGSEVAFLCDLRILCGERWESKKERARYSGAPAPSVWKLASGYLRCNALRKCLL